jgi:transcription-repair coupling factor (superfamily II helicase)
MTKNLLSGVVEGFEPFVLQQLVTERSLLFVARTETKAQQTYEQLKILAKSLKICYFPGWDCLPYDRISPNHDIVSERVRLLCDFVDNPKTYAIIICSAATFLQLLPPKSQFHGQAWTLKPTEKIAHAQFLEYLTNKGYQRSETVREAGEFAVRGGLIDLFSLGAEHPVRIDFFGDEIENLRFFDPLTQKTLGPCPSLILRPAHEILLTSEAIHCFRQKYRQIFGAVKSSLYESISAGRRYAGMEHWLPLFFESLTSLEDYLANPQIICDFQLEEAIQARLETIETYFKARAQIIPGDASPPYLPIPPEHLFRTHIQWQDLTHQSTHLTPFSQPNAPDYHCRLAPDFTQIRHQQNVFDYLKQWMPDLGKPLIICCFSEGSRDRLAHVLCEHGLDATILEEWSKALPPLAVITYPLERGYETPEAMVLSEQDLLGDRLIRSGHKKRQAPKALLEASQLSTGDLVVHRDHGIGRYEGLVTLSINQAAHDCLCLIYEGGDKLFLPVENVEAITRYGSDDSIAQLDKLGSNAWQNRKTRVKKRIREIADYLIKIAAERALHRGDIISKKEAEYDEFCTRFPYPETDDQLRAIDETLEDLSSGKPMDRLVCGDVGFGKTEVALRAAFVAAASGKQVAIISPTTLLCRQHYKTFSERFQGFPYQVAQLSRFVSPKQAQKVRQDLEQGNVNIVIATHALFSDKVKFADLGLVIIDEEQHFGVKQKEKLKSLQKDIHVLTLTATPIPRTLQLALTGVREMSLITTPPIDRLAVRTFVMPSDPLVIREAILREYFRGGQTFYVCPRLEELAKLEQQLKTLVPEVKITTAHGQMPTQQLEDVMTAFYDRQFDVLVSTNIVESGIDIANANTLIIHRADLFGLAQLYQLRGRVGRAKVQGYAYLTLPSNQALSAHAQKRLEIMQTLDKLGAGFMLASHDMDIRGTGNLVGEEQSGHIKEVGVELYQHLLQEAIMMVRAEQELGTPVDAEWTPQINLGTSVMIPETYISDLNLRLNLYRRIADLKTRDEINIFAAEMIDRFGKLPEEVKNLFEIIELKSLCRTANIEKVDAGPKGVVITFRHNEFPQPIALLQWIQQPKMFAKLRPDQKLVFMREWHHPTQRAKNVKIICQKLAKLATKS